MKVIVSILLLMCSACWIHAQTVPATCPMPEFGNTQPMIVSDLPEACLDLRETAQCCTRAYILERLDFTEEEFRMALREELQGRFDRFTQLALRIRAFLQERTFLSSLLGGFADFSFLQVGSNAVSQFVDELRERLDIEDGVDFRVRELLERVLNRIKDEAAQEYAGVLGAQVQQCVRDTLQERVDMARMEALAAAIEQVRRVQTSLDRLAQFLENLNTTLLEFRPLRQCVNRLVELADCDSCLVVRPPICRNWCGALARACYSPFYQVLNQQFERFWMVSREVIDLLPGLWSRLSENGRVLRVGAREVITAIQQCSTDITTDFIRDLLPDFPGIGKRQTADDRTNLPDLPGFDREGDDLRGGAFEYDLLDGPRICRARGVRRQNCWDGNEERADDIPSFNVDEIDGQDANPAIQINEADLQAQASALGSPVDTFLDDPAFTSTAPDGVTGSGGSQALTFTFGLLVAGLLVAMGFN